ncbi:MAG: hypothetical protein WC117_00370 [Sphaerochaetaceae bacterium]|jgi:hypothetical protein
MLTKKEIELSLPAHLKSSATQELADKVNAVTSDPIMAEHIRDNFISYVGVLREGKFKTEDYLNAVTYTSYKLMGYSNQDAYFKTFPARHQALVAKGTSSKDISAYVSAYHKGKLVTMIIEQSLVPSWVLNQDVYQKAINVQADLMLNAQSEKVRSDAANSLLTHLSKPKEAGPLINIDMRETSGMKEMQEMMMQIATRQREAIGAGVTTKEIAAQRIFHDEVVG